MSAASKAGIDVEFKRREDAPGWVGRARLEDGTTVIAFGATDDECARALVDRIGDALGTQRARGAA